MDNKPLQCIESENNNTLTDLLQNQNSEEEYDNSTLNFDKHSPYYITSVDCDCMTSRD